MEKRKLGNLEVSAVGLGCMGMTHAYGAPADKAEMTKLLQDSIDIGYTFFDTAECYTGKNADGSIEHNEDLVGNALKPYRKDIVIASKFGVKFGHLGLITDSSEKTIRQSIEGSLKRLQTDYIDLYYQHRIDSKVPAEEVARVMSELIKEGKILHWGISETTEDYLRRANAVCQVTCIQNRLSMMARWNEDLFPVLEELNVGFVAFSPLANGTLTDGYVSGSKFERGDFRNFMPQYRKRGYAANKALTGLLCEIAKEKNATQAQIALAWMLNKKPFIVPIPGSRQKSRISENAGAANVILSKDEVAQIDKKLDGMKMSGVFGANPFKKRK